MKGKLLVSILVLCTFLALNFETFVNDEGDVDGIHSGDIEIRI
ncbi:MULTISPECIES: hypothetical protein [Heyndrickxia]|nr:hypothetical protein [Heyndrickxia oleronia]GIN40094.1 hypothetical protein J19TS1_30430 [Heyndrickxia oleronia]